MNINKKKYECQSEALNAWHKRRCLGTLQLCTGAGKTYAALRAIKWIFSFNPDANVLIICPTEIIRDDTFPKEFRNENETFFCESPTLQNKTGLKFYLLSECTICVK